MQNLSRVAIFISLIFLAFSGQTANSSDVGKIDINTASLEELIKIIHIGEIRARELISLRPFSSINDLIRIKGIGEKNLEDIKKQGLAWVSNQPQLKADESIVENQETYPTGVLINEILPSPEGFDAENEWIEIFNQNNFEVELSKWKISDTAGSIKIYTFPEETKILAKEYLILSRIATKITLNNDGDGLKLIQPNSEIVDSITYEKAPKAQSFNRTAAGWAWSSTFTPGSENIVPSSELFKEEVKEEKPAIGSLKVGEEEIAAISQAFQNAQEKEIKKSFPSLFAALSLAVFSGILILFFKKRLKLRNKKI